MALPSKSYFKLEEITDRWNATISDLQYYGENGILEFCIREQRILVSLFEYIQKDQGLHKVQKTKRYMPEPQPIHSVDVFRIFTAEDKKVIIKRFKPRAPLEFMKIWEENGLPVSKSDLVITRDERNRFEEKHNIIPFESDAPEIFSYRNHYTDVKIMGERHKLGPVQANIVRELHQASNSLNPWLYGKTLLDRAGSKSIRLSGIFNHHKNWRDIICSDGRGRYRLNVPFVDPDKKEYSLIHPSLFD